MDSFQERKHKNFQVESDPFFGPNFISQNTVINDKMTSIDQKIVYETLSTGIFFFIAAMRQ